MAAAWMRSISDLRKRWRGAAVLVVMFGLVGGTVLSTAAGARRTSSAYDRLLEASKAYDVEIQPTGEEDPALLDRIAALPQVADHGRIAFVPATQAARQGTPAPFQWDMTAVALVDPSISRTMEIPRVVEGRSPHANAVDEAAVSPEFARSRGVGVGDTLKIQTVTLDELFQLFDGTNPTPTGPVVAVRIVGVWRVPHDVSIDEVTGILFLTPAFHRAYVDRIATLTSLFVRLHGGGSDIGSFVDAARDAGGAASLDIVDQKQLVATVNRALDVQSTGLWILSLAIALAALLVLGQALGRWLARRDRGPGHPAGTRDGTLPGRGDRRLALVDRGRRRGRGRARGGDRRVAAGALRTRGGARAGWSSPRRRAGHHRRCGGDRRRHRGPRMGPRRVLGAASNGSRGDADREAHDRRPAGAPRAGRTGIDRRPFRVRTRVGTTRRARPHRAGRLGAGHRRRHGSVRVRVELRSTSRDPLGHTDGTGTSWDSAARIPPSSARRNERSRRPVTSQLSRGRERSRPPSAAPTSKRWGSSPWRGRPRP